MNVLKNLKMKRIGNLKKLLCLCAVISLPFTIPVNTARAVKILATVNSAIITDYDTEEFSKILCLLENKHKSTNKTCNQQIIIYFKIFTNIKFIHTNKWL